MHPSGKIVFRGKTIVLSASMPRVFMVTSAFTHLDEYIVHYIYNITAKVRVESYDPQMRLKLNIFEYHGNV